MVYALILDIFTCSLSSSSLLSFRSSSSILKKKEQYRITCNALTLCTMGQIYTSAKSKEKALFQFNSKIRPEVNKLMNNPHMYVLVLLWDSREEQITFRLNHHEVRQSAALSCPLLLPHCLTGISPYTPTCVSKSEEKFSSETAKN